MSTPFREFALMCEKLENISSKLSKIQLVNSFLKKLVPDELPIAVRMIIGKIFPPWSDKNLDISWNSILKILKSLTKIDDKEIIEIYNRCGDPGELFRIVMKEKQLTKQQVLLGGKLTVLEVYRMFESIARIKGKGSRERKERILYAILSKAEPLEAKFIIRMILGEMRHGVSEGIMEEALSDYLGVPLETLRRAHMIFGDLGKIIEIAVREGIEHIIHPKFRLFNPIKPMLAQTAQNIQEVIKEHGKTAFEYKFDGARVQIHKKDDEVRIFSRRLTDVTISLPDIVELIKREIRSREIVVEGEVIAISKDNKPLPFQQLMKRFKRIRNIEKKVKELPTRLFLFDILYLDGKLLIDEPYIKRRALLENIVRNIDLAPMLVTDNISEAQKFLEQALEHGHEGLMAKKLNSRYTPGVRGKNWFKIKKALRLDLVIVAAEWGHGRRHNWLSDYYLATRDLETGEFLIVGKTFKGLTDAEFKDITKRLLELKIGERRRTVFVKPEIVAEVAFNEIQKSPKYKSGYALRFARIVRIREDKSPEDADSIQRIKILYERQFKGKSMR
ncbi:MAG: ATP-dependent DNA ligase [Candidatus Korarchaeota archaeon]|nr:ATP-dependent DNA ligase [Candidatus Korarchaeota archaeon]